MQRRHQESAFRLTFALPPFFQQTVLCHLQRHTGLGLDRSNHHLICRRHREHEECAVDDIGELTECSSTRRLPAQKWWDGWSHWPLPPSLLMRRALSCIAPCPAHSLWLLAPLACPRFRWLEDPLLAEDGVDLHRPGTIVLLIETLDLGGEWLLAVGGHGGMIWSRMMGRYFVVGDTGSWFSRMRRSR